MGTTASRADLDRDAVRPPLATDQGNAANAQDSGLASTGPFLGDSAAELAAWMSCEDESEAQDLTQVTSGSEIVSHGAEIYGEPVVERLGSGEHIFELTVDEQPLIDEFDVLWECLTWPECGTGKDDDFENTDLATRLRAFLEGTSLAGSGGFHTGWEWSGSIVPGVTQVSADVEFEILNPVPIAAGAGTVNASASGTVADTYTSATELSAGGEFGGKVSYANDEDAGKATASGKATETQSTTFTSMGTNSLAMSLPAQVFRGTLRATPTLKIGGALLEVSRTGPPVEIGTVTYGRISE